MTIFYKNGFYTEPQENSVELTDEQYQALIIGQSQGKQIVSNAESYPILIDPQPSPYHELQGVEWVISEAKQTELLAKQRQQVRDKINALRDRKINGGVYVSAIDKWIDSDATAERNILSVKATFDLFGDQEIPWTFADNSVAMINKEKLLVIWQVLMEAKTGNHANALKHKAMMKQSENPLEYDYSSGWTQTYEDFAGAANE